MPPHGRCTFNCGSSQQRMTLACSASSRAHHPVSAAFPQPETRLLPAGIGSTHPDSCRARWWRLDSRAWRGDQVSLGPSADKKYRRPELAFDSLYQQPCVLHLRYRTGRQLFSLSRSTLWVESGRPNIDHAKSLRILSSGLSRGRGGSRGKRPLCALNSILALRPHPLS